MAVNQGRWKETRFTDDETTDSVVCQLDKETSQREQPIV